MIATEGSDHQVIFGMDRPDKLGLGAGRLHDIQGTSQGMAVTTQCHLVLVRDPWDIQVGVTAVHFLPVLYHTAREPVLALEPRIPDPPGGPGPRPPGVPAPSCLADAMSPSRRVRESCGLGLVLAAGRSHSFAWSCLSRDRGTGEQRVTTGLEEQLGRGQGAWVCL